MKRRRASAGVLVEAGADYGPSLRVGQDGRLRSWGGAAAVEIEIRDDPAVVDRKRPVRGARRRDVLADLCARRLISKRHVDAAERFLEDCSIACGSIVAELSGLPGISGPRACLPERQVAAVTRINRVRLLLGLNAGTVFWWVVFGNGSVREWETVSSMRNGAGIGLLQSALTALDEHYHGATSKRGT